MLNLAKAGEAFSFEFLSKLIVERLTGRKSSESPSAEISSFSLKDNVLVAQLIAEAEKEYRVPNKEFYTKFWEFMDNVWEKTAAEAKEKAREIAKAGVETLAKNQSVFNVEGEAKQLVFLPLLAYFAESANTNWDRAMRDLKNFCEMGVDQRYAYYVNFAGQPERFVDMVWRKLFQIKKNWDELGQQTWREANAPDGVLGRLDAKLKAKKQKNRR